jgi:hypothetical protein
MELYQRRVTMPAIVTSSPALQQSTRSSMRITTIDLIEEVEIKENE